MAFENSRASSARRGSTQNVVSNRTSVPDGGDDEQPRRAIRAARHLVGQAERRQRADRVGDEPVAAGLVARKLGPIEQQHTAARARQLKRRHRAGGTGAGD